MDELFRKHHSDLVARRLNVISYLFVKYSGIYDDELFITMTPMALVISNKMIFPPLSRLNLANLILKAIEILQNSVLQILIDWTPYMLFIL